LKDPKRKLTDDERRSIVLQVDDILGLGGEPVEIQSPSILRSSATAKDGMSKVQSPEAEVQTPKSDVQSPGAEVEGFNGSIENGDPVIRDPDSLDITPFTETVSQIINHKS